MLYQKQAIVELQIALEELKKVAQFLEEEIKALDMTRKVR